MVNAMLRENDDFFYTLENRVNIIYNRTPFKEQLRIREPIELNTDFLRRLDELTGEIKKFVSRARTEDDENEIKNYFTKFTRIKNTIITFLDQKEEGQVYWMEFRQGRRKNVTLYISPLDMAEYFRENVFAANRLSVMTSATLSESGTMDYFKKSVGAEEITSAILSSPFDFGRQMKIYIDGTIPEPVKKGDFDLTGNFTENEYELVLPEKIIEYVRITEGGALLLFTNIRLLRRIYEKIKPELNSLGITCLSQSDGVPRNKLLEEFKKESNSVLMGVDSFWMGIDVPGESLRNVIITRLPFDIPDHPLVEAKIEYMKEQGKNPFYEYSLPNAILKFRQGVGRLIRNKTDEGIVCILDSRIINKTYGRRFIASVPECEIVVNKV
jgi:ATP-dependent DNA helicase DinG